MEYPVIGKEIIHVHRNNMGSFTRTDAYAYDSVMGIVIFANRSRRESNRFDATIKGAGRVVDGCSHNDPIIALQKAKYMIETKGFKITMTAIKAAENEAKDFEYAHEPVKYLDKFWIMDILNMGIL